MKFHNFSQIPGKSLWKLRQSLKYFQEFVPGVPRVLIILNIFREFPGPFSYFRTFQWDRYSPSETFHITRYSTNGKHNTSFWYFTEDCEDLLYFDRITGASKMILKIYLYLTNSQRFLTINSWYFTSQKMLFHDLIFKTWYPVSQYFCKLVLKKKSPSELLLGCVSDKDSKTTFTKISEDVLVV